MQFENLAQPPLETSLMGVVRGVFDHSGIPASTPWLYGATGHAFVLNIHEQLCPSGPYCWDGDGWARLLENLGVTRKGFAFFTNAATPEERAAVEKAVREHLARGVLCSMINMDNQLIAGYDETGFLNCRPWGECSYTPERLTFGTWDELGEEIHLSFYRYERVDGLDARAQAKASLEYAASLWTDPKQHTEPGYGMGPDGYAHWTKALESIEPDHHGAWWNATVWSECRSMAAAYLEEIAERFPEAAEPARAASKDYAEIAGLLKAASDKAMPVADRIPRIDSASALESRAVGFLPDVLAHL